MSAGVLARIAIAVGFTPAFVVAQSATYLRAVSGGRAGTPSLGYAWLELTPLSWMGSSLVPVTVFQHVCGVAAAAAAYVLLIRWGVWRWLAALAAVPAMLDARVITSEHLVLPDSLFVLLMALALLVLAGRARPRLWVAVAVGLLLGAASTLVAVAAPLLVLGLVGWVALSASSRQRLGGAVLLVIAFAAVVAPYAVWQHGSLEPASIAKAVGLSGTPSRLGSAVTRTLDGSDLTASRWQPQTYPVTHHTAAHAFDAFAGVADVPFPLPLAGLALGLMGALGLYRARRSKLRTVSMVTALLPVAVFVGTELSGESVWHVQQPLLVWGPAAGALGLTALLRGHRSPSADRAQYDEIDAEAMQSFADRYDGSMRLAPVVVVIAAYNEGPGLPSVLDSIPTTVCGLDTDVLVVDDGSKDQTAAAALAHPRAYVAACGTNRGQGAALRLGYRLGRTHGARYIITTDADGQYDTADFPSVLAPILDGSADFVTGSRRLGHQHTMDQFRRVGVHVFAWIVSAMVGQWHTDTSFGLRAMRAETTAEVTLNQPQYQSSELMIGMHAHGFRVLEVPGTMHIRASGSTKKGGNLVYGARYARVVVSTWWREGCPRPAADRAPALRGRS